MLRPPYTKYSRIYTYHIDTMDLPEIKDPDHIGTWVEDNATITVFHKPKSELLEDMCRQNGCNVFYEADVDYNDWEMGQEIVPFCVEQLKVAPVWDSSEADIIIDPSVVFGNGFHPSTRLCLESLVNISTFYQKGFTALDLGCGTGLLSVTAARLGASGVTAVDFNSLACKVAKRNAELNDVLPKITVKQLDLKLDLPVTDVDILMANLHHTLLAELFKSPEFWQAEIYIFSGFMAHEEEELLAALPDKPPTLLERRSLDKWRMWIMGSRKV